MYTADLHIHSKYSRATSQDCDGPHLELWARYKGISLLGTGDFTHPAWRQELEACLEEAEEGLYTLKEAFRLPEGPRETLPRFVVSGEVSCIYKRHGKTRKVHNLILLPGLEAADRLSARLEILGNIRSDGRPILGLDSRDLLEVTLEACPEAIFIPAHIWTPHFSIFGAFSAFSSVEECFGDLSPHIRALETGLSADPPMLWRVSGLDGYTLLSHSDAHSPSKLAREADLLDAPLSYPGLRQALTEGTGFLGTLEFFPEEGKYHLDGHRACGVCLTPAEAEALGGICPVCGKKLTIGVEHRALELADRPQGFQPPGAKPFASIMPLMEVLGESLGLSPASKGIQRAYFSLLEALGPELYILREAPLEEIGRSAGPLLAEGIRRLRAGEVKRQPGFDGQYGKISLFAPEEREAFGGQTALLDLSALAKKREKAFPAPSLPKAPSPAEAETPTGPAPGPNPRQLAAIESDAPALGVVAGPGTGKTSTLVDRILYLIQKKGVSPREITAVTFTNLAAQELQSRIRAALGPREARGLTAGTFHSISLGLLPAKPLLGRQEALGLLAPILAREGYDLSPAQALEGISRRKAGLESPLPEGLYEAYEAACQERGCRDLDGLLLEALKQDAAGHRAFTHLLVDEFQDINPVQRRLVCHWMQPGGSLFVIGDPDQSIYGFRGASAACFAELKAQVPCLSILTLEENYRSTPQIVEAATGLLQAGDGRPRPLRPCRSGGVPLRFLMAPTPFEEALWIAKEISRLAGGLDMLEAAGGEKPRAFEEMAILCRTHRQLDLIESCLRHDSIPCVIRGREDYLLDPAVEGALGFFRALLQPEDTPGLVACLSHVWNCPADLIEQAARVYASMQSPDPDALRESLGDSGHLSLWLEEVAAYGPRIKKEKPRRLFLDWAKDHGPSLALDKLASAAAFHDTLADFLLALYVGEEGDLRRASGKAYASGAVQLMTLHGAKGLEFPLVFLAGLQEGMLPLCRPGLPEDIEEERRLLYVGMTRAKEALILTGSGQPSSFAKDLPLSPLPLPRRARQGEQLSFF